MADLATLQVNIEGAGVDEMTARLNRLADAGARAEGSAGTVSGAVNNTASAARAGAAAVGGFGDANLRAAEAASHHQITLGRVERSLESFIVQTTGANEQVGLLAAAFGHLEIGAVGMIAVLGGTFAVLKVYELLTEDTRKAREEQDKLTESLGKWYDAQQRGAGGGFLQQIGAEEKALGSLRTTLDNTLRGTSAGGIFEVFKADVAAIVAGSFDPNQAGIEFTTRWAQYVQAQKDAITKGEAEVQAAAKAAFAALIDEGLKKNSEQSGGLASLISGGQASGAVYADASAAIARYQHALDGLRQAYSGLSDANKELNLRQQAGLLADLTQLTDALHAAEMHRLDALTETTAEAEKQRALQDLLTVDVVKYSAAVRDGQVVTKDGQIVYESTIATTVRLTDLLAAEEAQLRKTAEATSILTAEQKKALAGDPFHITGGPIGDLTTLGNEVKKDTAALNDFTRQGLTDYAAQMTKAAEITRQATDEVHHLSETVGRELVRAVVDFAASGNISFSTFLKDGSNLALRIVGQFDQGVSELQGKLKEAMKIGGVAGESAVATIKGQLDQLESQAAKIKDLAAGIGGLSLGYSLGQQGQAGLGAVGGAAQGFLTAGPGGAAIGAVAGVVGGLLGAAQAHREAAAALHAAGDRIQASLQNFAGFSGPTAALAQNAATYQQLRSAIIDDIREAAHQGDRGAFQTGVTQLGQLDAENAANAQRIVQNFFAGLTQQLNALNGPAGNYQNALDALNKEYADNVATIEATFGGQDKLNQATELYQKKLDALNAAYAEAAKQLQFSLDAREAYAKGLTAEGDAIARRAQEDKELFDAQQAGYTDAQIAQLKYIQGLEDEAALKKQLADANNALAQNLAGGPGGTAASALAASLAPLLQKQAADQEAYNQAVIDGVDPMTQLALQVTLAADAAAIAATAFQATVAALQQSTSDIENAVSGGFISGASGLAGERSNLGTLFGIDPSTITDALLKSLYTDPTQQGGLTNQQRAQNAAIDQFFKDEAQWGPQMATAAAALASPASGAFTSATTAITSGARALTDQVGNRMADYLATLVIRTTEIRDDNRNSRNNAYGGSGVTVIVQVPPGASQNDVAAGKRIAKTVDEALGSLKINTDRSRGVNTIGGTGSLIGG
ncbi:MAG TPA: hypothetical protein VGQ44_17265 [Gemmatimonadaceae bacterium]|jgi:hypothetical protein|nr:hypothetical protein [Gemmatimonadaceae bacterium]